MLPSMAACWQADYPIEPVLHPVWRGARLEPLEALLEPRRGLRRRVLRGTQVQSELEPVVLEPQALVELVDFRPRRATRGNQLVAAGFASRRYDLADERRAQSTPSLGFGHENIFEQTERRVVQVVGH